MKIGAQLYTVRDFCRTLDDFSETLKKLADIGYTTVQVSGTCPYEAQWLDEQLKKNGLTCDITHFDYNKIVNDTENTIAFHKAFGCRYIGLGYPPNGAAGYPNLKTQMKLPAQKIHEAGLQFCYHNHDIEYKNKLEDGRILMHHMSEDFTPEEMCFTLDTYWVKAGGYDVVEEINRLSGRLPVVHYKDMLLDGDKMLMSYIGGGNTMDFEKITEAFIAAGTTLAYVEQDDCNGEDPFVCLKKSYDYLKSIGLN